MQRLFYFMDVLQSTLLCSMFLSFFVVIHGIVICVYVITYPEFKLYYLFILLFIGIYVVSMFTLFKQHISLCTQHESFLSITTGSTLLECRDADFQFFYLLTNLFPKLLYKFSLLSAIWERFCFSISSPTLNIASFKIFIPIAVSWLFIVILICIYINSSYLYNCIHITMYIPFISFFCE